MKFFIDTANLEHIREAVDMGVLDGVTTNPSLMAKEGIREVRSHYRRIAEMVPDVSAEVLATDYNGIVAEGRDLASIHEHITVKIPMIKDGVKAIRTLSEEGIRINCTLIFSPVQALIAAKAGARYVSPFLGRLDDIGHEGMQLVEEIRLIFDNYAFNTEILAASIRHVEHLRSAALVGADIATMPFAVIEKMLKHPLTDRGLEAFLADAKRNG
ncbi:MAG: fructose-6-phosphate aldolase [Bacteroidetes bacterium]|nr:MAG: fructose-6-phosphate aldolase [Bacteroidota bacterium]